MPGPSSVPVNDGVIGRRHFAQRILRELRLADRATVHGLRSASRDWRAETCGPRELAEALLPHAVGGVEGAYARSDPPKIVSLAAAHGLKPFTPQAATRAGPANPDAVSARGTDRRRHCLRGACLQRTRTVSVPRGGDVGP